MAVVTATEVVVIDMVDEIVFDSEVEVRATFATGDTVAEGVEILVDNTELVTSTEDTVTAGVVVAASTLGVAVGSETSEAGEEEEATSAWVLKTELVAPRLPDEAEATTWSDEVADSPGVVSTEVVGTIELLAVSGSTEAKVEDTVLIIFPDCSCDENPVETAAVVVLEAVSTLLVTAGATTGLEAGWSTAELRTDEVLKTPSVTGEMYAELTTVEGSSTDTTDVVVAITL